MEVLSAELVRNLVRWRGGGNPVISLYLNVDGRDHVRAEDYFQRLESLIREAHIDSSLDDDVERIRRFVRTDFERGSNRGLAIYSAGTELWSVVALPHPVDDHLIVNSSPHVRVLENMIYDNQATGVLLTDKQRARILVIELGKVSVREEVVDPLPRHDDDGGDWRKDHVKNHSETFAKQHLRNAAQAMFEIYKQHPFEYLVLGVAEESKPELVRHLHAYLRPKLAGRMHIGINASDEEVIEASRELVKNKRQAMESEFVERLRAGLPNDSTTGVATESEASNSVAGLDHTLKAIFEKRVETLLVSEGFVAEGWRCHDCNYIATLGRKCAMCGSEMSLVDDVIEEAVEDALSQNCQVEFCRSNADLDVMGQIGALLRF
jgi:peptide chain release factor subunit 1